MGKKGKKKGGNQDGKSQKQGKPQSRQDQQQPQGGRRSHQGGRPQTSEGCPSSEEARSQQQQAGPSQQNAKQITGKMMDLNVKEQERQGRSGGRRKGGQPHSQEPSLGQSQSARQRPSPALSATSSVAGDVETASVKSSGSSGTSAKSSNKAPGGLPKMCGYEKTRCIEAIPRRKNPNKAGTLGRRIRVQTNMLRLIFKSEFKIPVCHYDMKFDPDRPKFLKKLAFEAMKKNFFRGKNPAFDGRVNAYSAGDLPFGERIETEVKIIDDDQRERTVKIKMVKVKSIDISWLKRVRPGIEETERDQTTMQVLDVILRSASYDRAIMTGRLFFTQPGNPINLGTSMELWSGLFQSAVLGWRPYLNADVAFKAFPKSQNVIDCMKELCFSRKEESGQLTPDIVERNRRTIEDFLKSLKVVYQLPGKPSTKRTVGVNGLGKSAREATFVLGKGQTASVYNYFRSSKNYNIRFPELPCLWVGSKNKRTLVPLELCTIAAGNVTNAKLDEYQTKKMIKETATNTKTRRANIEEAFRAMKFNEHPAMREFGIQIDPRFEEVDARILDPPEMKDSEPIKSQKGIWKANGFHRTQGVDDNKWTILNISNVRREKLHIFVDKMRSQASELGMKLGNPFNPFRDMRPPGRDIRELMAYLQEMKQKGMKLIFVVIPGKGQEVYPKVKQVAELQVGILTQCIKDNTVDEINQTKAGNILLKVNSKLNGINHTFQPQTKPDCVKRPCIIFGADVTHPSPDAKDIPSIAAVAASLDPTAFRYNIMIHLQPPRQEIILHLEEIVYKQIRIFEAHNKCKPEKIIFYRDGVSEGQFPQVMHYELTAIKNACTKLGAPNKYEPKITFLVVQKRHHIRFFPSDPKNSDDKGGNVQAGTVVDTDITHPSHIDFYLVSHASIQGTARPTKYRCLCDENNMSEDEIEKLTYYLCHMFSRCTRSVSYPAPTYYAHLAAFRARSWIQGMPINIENLEHEQRNRLTLKDDLTKNNPMFFV